jgi:protein-disulfide isomerase
MFWEMHDALFENQGALDFGNLIVYATNLGLDVGRVAAELEQRMYLPRVKEDVASGTRSGVNGTPTFFINGVRFDGSWDEHGLVAALSPHVAP